MAAKTEAQKQINMWDMVRIITTKRINWVSAPEGIIPIPHGVWTVVGILGTDLLVSKESCLCRVPIKDAEILSAETNGQK